MYAPGGEGGLRRHAFSIVAMLKKCKCVQGGEWGQIWPKNAIIRNGQPLTYYVEFVPRYFAKIHRVFASRLSQSLIGHHWLNSDWSVIPQSLIG